MSTFSSSTGATSSTLATAFFSSFGAALVAAGALFPAALAASNYGNLYPVSNAIAATFLNALISIWGTEVYVTIPSSNANAVTLLTPKKNLSTKS